MNTENKQIAILFAIVVIGISAVIKGGTEAIKDGMNKKVTVIQADMEKEKEKTLAKKDKQVNETVEKKESQGEDDKSKQGDLSINDSNNKDSTNDKDKLKEALEGDTNTTQEVDKTAKDCYNKNGNLYYNGVCVPIPAGFKYLMKQDGFVAYVDSSYTNMFMVYIKKHNMDVASDGIEEFTYGFGASSLVKDGPKKMAFGKNLYQRYELETDGVTTYAFITASSTKVAYIQLVTASGSVSWAKKSLTNLTYY